MYIFFVAVLYPHHHTVKWQKVVVMAQPQAASVRHPRHPILIRGYPPYNLKEWQDTRAFW